jgi:Domain of Unknown Function with PDB structure (DUF3857)/Transglutaminase-like superfamily
VIRLSEYTFEILSLSEVSKKKHLIVTLFNKKGEAEFSNFQEFYGRYIKIKKIEGNVYSASGEKLASLKKDQIYDMTTSEEAYEVSDVRTKIMVFESGKYAFPYTIEFICATETKMGMFYPEWSPITGSDIGIEQSNFSVIVPKAMPLRYKEFHITHQSELDESGKMMIYKWQLENKAPIRFESYMPENQLPYVYTAPTEFKVEDFSGNASTWKSIGQFNYQLNQNRAELSLDLQQKIKTLVQNESDTLKRIQLLYEWMQKRTRYISVQLGIGGWQTLPASEVEKKGVGDCKALSNFTVAVLKAAGIKAYMALVNAGKNDLDMLEDFPNLRFNHMIVCVPRQNDSLWLECTSQTNAMGYQGSFTGNRKALLLTENGGYLVSTTAYTAKDNWQKRKVVISIHVNGDAMVSMKTVCSGIRSERLAAQLNQLDQLEQQKAIVANLDIPDFVLNTFNYQINKSRVPEIKENLELKINKLCLMKAPSQFLKPNLFLTIFSRPDASDERKYDFYLNPNVYTINFSDTIVYQFPSAITVESLPPEAVSKTIFGTYTSKYVAENDKVIYYRQIMIKGGSFPKSEFVNWTNFLKFITKKDRTMAIVKPKSN